MLFEFYISFQVALSGDFMSHGSDSTRDMSHLKIFIGQIQGELVYGFTFLIINKLHVLVVCF